MTAEPLLKEALQPKVRLPVDRDIRVMGLEEQKGSDILAEAIPQFIREKVQITILVKLELGKKPMEELIQPLEILQPDKARVVDKFNIPLAH